MIKLLAIAFAIYCTVTLANEQTCGANLVWYDPSYQHGEEAEFGHDFYGWIPAAHFELIKSHGCPVISFTVLYKGMESSEVPLVSANGSERQQYDIALPSDFLTGDYTSIDHTNVQIKNIAP